METTPVSKKTRGLAKTLNPHSSLPSMSPSARSFSAATALRRLLLRCPSLASNSRLLALSQKGTNIAEEDVVAALADPFLHPSYTIPIVGCFRPLCQEIADRVVAKLRSVPNLESDNVEAGGEEIGDDNAYVIDFYVGKERRLRLHELASLALCRALDLAPFLLGSVLNYLKSSPPFKRLLLLQFNSQVLEKDISHMLEAIRISYRLLVMEPEIFVELWDWSCFLDLMQLTSDLGVICSPDVRWCTIQILILVFKISDRAVESFRLKTDEAFACLLRFEDFCKDTSMEKVSCFLQVDEAEHDRCFGGTVDTKSILLLDDCPIYSSSTFELEGKKRDICNKHSSDVDHGNPFVITSSIKRSFEMVLMAVSQKWPILLYGPEGSGKTALVNRLAHISGNEVLFIHMDEQMDSKELIGSYICTEQAGEFLWQPGSLTQAICNGYWVVFEDIDKSSNEIHSIILPLLEGSTSFVTGHGQAISVGESFRLFSTISTARHDYSHEIGGKVSFSSLWRKVMLRTPTSMDMVEIVTSWYPSLKPISSRLIDTFERMCSLSSRSLGGVQEVGGFSSPYILNRFTLRDLLKWCKRIAGGSLDITGLDFSAVACQNIYKEALDVFAAYLPNHKKRISVAKEIANLWGVLIPESDYIDSASKPVIQVQGSYVRVGRAILQSEETERFQSERPFISIKSALHVLEGVACSVKHIEPVLLVGETGTGKTTLVQFLAMKLGQPLTVLNLSQQTDVSDLLGGYKPADARSICLPLYQDFKEIVRKTSCLKGNEELLRTCEVYQIEKNWKKLLSAFQKSVKFVSKHIHKWMAAGSGSKRKRDLLENDLVMWESFSFRLFSAQTRIDTSTGAMFNFVEGAFITALRKGHWILLDEVNLAPAETLQRISGVLEGEKGTLCLAERGDIDYIDRHPSFRLFACMNPANDAGKRELPYSFRSRFTEYFVDDILDDDDLCLFVNQYMNMDVTDTDVAYKIVRFYKAAKKQSEDRLQDGSNQKPQFSLRSLARALEYTKMAQKTFGFRKALYDGFCMFFLTSLDGPSSKIMKSMILSILLDGCLPHDVCFDAYLIDKSSHHDMLDSVEDYVLTKSVKEHLKNLARAVFVKKYPVLLQGPTSSGKTSLVRYLASATGRDFLRINNHEHTDLQEYYGTYITDPQGRLQFQEGVLVKAVRNGHWIVLDELNLAPSDVLEALNRLLDDNRELYVPELQERILAHPNFMLFATQNPPMLYGGRKMLSRAFRNRFLEIHVDEIPEDELTTILELRCKIPRSYALKMVEIMKDLQLNRQHTKVFAGKHGFITPRDLFRWANRFRIFGKSHDDLARDGYYLLAERLRDENEKVLVCQVLEKHLGVKMIIDGFYTSEANQEGNFQEYANQNGVQANFGNITWTKSMRRLFFLVERCYKLREPVLLVGETGGGKTTVCQLLSVILKSKLHIINCHQYTETSDFIGGFYPLRDRTGLANEFKLQLERLKMLNFFLQFSEDVELSSDISQASLTVEVLNRLVDKYKLSRKSHPDITEQDLSLFQQLKCDLEQLQQKWQTLFVWQDGPLVQAMKDGDLFLIDEISLADDSVIERLNSVLEPERKLSLAEKGGATLETLAAHPDFFILATMNPGGDYGKKELSPALRNRFTEIWVPPVGDVNELIGIGVERFIRPELLCFAEYMLNFWQWFDELHTGRNLTIRDLLSWISFMNASEGSIGPQCAFLHGAFLILLDGLSLGTSIPKHEVRRLRETSLSFLLEKLIAKGADYTLVDPQLSKMETYGWGDAAKLADNLFFENVHSQEKFGISPFYIPKGCHSTKDEGFEFLAPTTSRNVFRVLRAMQLSKPVLLEGSPGVGKTSLIVALAEFSGHAVVRINLSEQTDMMDLLGSDLPIQGENGMEFSWSDGILLQALKNGSWVLLDELNLAPQSVLEGLNAILDHRAEVFVPELGSTFKCPPSFRVFACQNPSYQGGGRKGLPKSFLNRFTKVYVDELDSSDHLFICRSLYPSIPSELLSRLICFNKQLYEKTMIEGKFAQEGSPWEFNLRDIMKACQLIQEDLHAENFLSIVYLERMRTVADRLEVIKLYEEVFGRKPYLARFPKIHVNPNYLIIGSACAERNRFQPSKLLKSQLHLLPGILHTLEAVLHCVYHRWLCILVGPCSSGKTSLVRLLAYLTGNTLHELNLSAGTDVTDLLGCFEQFNSMRNFKSVVSQVERFISEYFSLKLEADWTGLMNEENNLFKKWFAFLEDKRISNAPFEYTSLDLLIEIINKLKNDQKMKHLSVSWSEHDLNKSLKIVLDLQRNFKIKRSASFEWVPSVLIKAIENGEWVVLEDANLCNPTVLDRINSLVEPSATITVNECGLLDGKPVVLHAHPKFRLFLTMDPRHGEVSRAMRNRGLEVFVTLPTCVPVLGQVDDTQIIDAKRYLTLSGIPNIKLVTAMSEAHVYAKKAGSHAGLSVTLLELSRWVHLFRQLLLRGNQPGRSLQLSWEHTYLSSFGEVEGMDVIVKAKLAYLSDIDWYQLDHLSGSSLSLPGGWPVPHTLRHLSWYSTEASVRQNCLFTEYLGSECASYEYRADSNPNNPSIVPIKVLHQVLFPDDAKNKLVKGISELEQLNLSLVNNKLFFAASWTIEQATQSNLLLYILWFKWYSLQLQPFSQNFSSFVGLLEQELEHPIWKCIFKLWKMVVSYKNIDINKRPLPLLSWEVVKLASSDRLPQNIQECLRNAHNSLRFLRLAYQQWDFEKDYRNGGKTLKYSLETVLSSLKYLEEEALKVIMESKELLQNFGMLIDYHMLFWKCIISSNYEGLVITWGLLQKEVRKLEPLLPRTSEEIRKLDDLAAQIFYVERPILWLHGGHPFVPSSADVYYKMQQFLRDCNSIWPQTNLLKKTYDDVHLMMEVVLSTNFDLRQLAVQGACMSLYLASREDMDAISVLSQIEDLNQHFSKKYASERNIIGSLFGSAAKSSIPDVECSTANCCSFCLENLCTKPGFESWLVTVALSDITSFSLDVKLLEELSELALDTSAEAHEVILKTCNPLQHALDYSLHFSSRSPLDFMPHQMTLWVLDAWKEVDSVNAKLSSFVLEMWFKFHSSMWGFFCEPIKEFGCHIDEPCHLVLPTRAFLLDRIIQSNLVIKDYEVNCQKFRVASRNLWLDIPFQKDLVYLLQSAATSLFIKIILTYRKSFDDDDFSKLKYMLCSTSGNTWTEEELKMMLSLISSSRHAVLRSSVSLVEPLLRGLFLMDPISDPLYKLGFAWLHIGILRFYLLLNQDVQKQDGRCHFVPDPVMKYTFKRSHILQKIAQLNLEIKVREESEYIAGKSFNVDDEDQILTTRKQLESVEKKLRKKVVFRPEPSKYKNLQSLYDELDKLLFACMDLVENLKCKAHPSTVSKACNWQVTAASFIKKLSDEYPEYADLVQPIQVAVYEMKLGLSLAISSALERNCLEKVECESFGRILGAVYSLMQFPRALQAYSNPIILHETDHVSTSKDVISSDHTNLLKKFVKEICPGSGVSLVELENGINFVALIHSAVRVSCSRLMDKDCFQLFESTFEYFSKLWLEMKSQLNVKAENDSREYKFRPRSVKIEDILGVDASPLTELDIDESPIHGSSEIEQEFNQTMKSSVEVERTMEECDFIPELMLKTIIRVHNRLFGLDALVTQPGHYIFPKEDALSSFKESYRLGFMLMEGLQSLRCFILDNELIPEHLFHLCIEYEDTFGVSSQHNIGYNVYKDPNAKLIHKMVKPLIAIQIRVKLFLHEWPEHPGLLKILDVVEMLLSAAPSTSLSKALLGLQALVGRIESLQEAASNFTLTDQLREIYSLVCSWQKIELDSWHTLLNGLQDKYASNAEKLWFPLHAVLRCRLYSSSESDKLFTIQSVEEFLQTSSVGEFQKRLQLLLAFHGQLNQGIHLGVYSSPVTREDMSILYNAFGYYMQFLPLVLDYIEAERRSIEKELDEHLKLFNWKRSQDFSLIESFRRTRKKLWKIVHKFNDVLEQPLGVHLSKEAMLKREKLPDWLQNSTCDEMNIDLSQFPLDIKKLNSDERFLWYDGWRKKVAPLQKMLNENSSGFDSLRGGDMRQSSSYDSLFTVLRKSWEDGWFSLEKICRSAAEFAHIWKHGNKNLRKRRALNYMLKILEESGLPRHKSTNIDLEQPSNFYLQPSYSILHLHQQEHKSVPSKPTTIDPQCDFEKIKHDHFGSKWRSASVFYFRNLATAQILRDLSFKCHKDLSLEQANRVKSFLNHLIFLQQEQRSAAYSASVILKKLRCQFDLLESRGDEFFASSSQNLLIHCMWEQKQLFDSLLSMSCETNLLLEKAKHTHLSTCSIMEDTAGLGAIVDQFSPMFLKSKELLDMHLLDHNGFVASTVSEVAFLVSKKHEQLVTHNFENIIRKFEEDIQSLLLRPSLRSLERILLLRFQELINQKKRKIEKFINELKEYEENAILTDTCKGSSEHPYHDAYRRMTQIAVDIINKLPKFPGGNTSLQEVSAENITLLRDLFQSCLRNLQLDDIYDAVTNMIVEAKKFIESASEGRMACSQIDRDMKSVCAFLDVILTFGEGIFTEFLDIHITIAEMTGVLAEIFVLIFSKGFGSSQEQDESNVTDGTQDASGTGIGEGEGTNDVSDQIEDEDQLLGTSEKDGLERSDRVPDKGNGGIEMEEDFDAETFSVSEDSGDSNSEDDENLDLESKMGEIDDSKQVADEKLSNEDGDGNQEKSPEKYESGPAVKDSKTSAEELRAKDDNALTREESGEMDTEEPDSIVEESKETENAQDDVKDDNEMSLDKSQAFEDPTGIQLPQQEQDQDQEFEEMDMDETEGSDVMDESTDEINDEDQMADQIEGMDDDNSDQLGEDVENKGGGVESDKANLEDAPESDKKDLSKDRTEQMNSMAAASDFPIADSSKSEVQWANSNDVNDSVAPSESLQSIEMGQKINSSDGSMVSFDHLQSKTQTSQDDNLQRQRTQANPFRSIGNAMEDWIERAKVSVEPKEHQSEILDDLPDDNADEYRYTSEEIEGTSQALGTATPDQIKGNLEENNVNRNESQIKKDDDIDKMDIKEISETSLIKSGQPSVPREKVNNELADALNNEVSEKEELQSKTNNQLNDLVSFRNSYLNETMVPFEMAGMGKESSSSMNIDQASSDHDLQKAILDWRRYEVSTTRLSQELSEQLRLVLEPTLASKLQGDYKTGKRINMKKVIAYIASHFRKDKIWLRRTRPNKRSYQVVVAVDDSRSMSESCCQIKATEALVTVCRAMSQLEVGQFAVASFGEIGKIKLLHDFDEPFTVEAGIKIISSLSFKQDNIISDEPMVDLLKYLNSMLDAAVVRARTPSGQNPLNQLILIIADGRFHEKENLKRYVRDALSRKRMVAFIIVDSSQESIMDLMEASFQGDKLSLDKYLNSFPFPYYIVLRNIEALPRTLGDLLRQWFELMQSADE